MQLMLCTVTPLKKQQQSAGRLPGLRSFPDVPAAAPDHVAVRPCGAAATLDPAEEDLCNCQLSTFRIQFPARGGVKVGRGGGRRRDSPHPRPQSRPES